jgi:molybdate transport system ATP-binding protein
VRIPGREIILATAAPPGLSLHNVLEGTVRAVHAEDDRAVVQIAIGGVRLLAEVTRDAVQTLGIAEGLPIYALVKSVSLEIRTTRGGESA